MAEKEELPKPPTEEAPKKEFDAGELFDIAGVEAAPENPEPSEPEPKPEPSPEPERPEPQEPQPRKEPPPEQPVEHHQVKQEQPIEPVKTEKEQALEERLKWYELLYGNEQPPEPYAAQPNAQPEPSRQPQPTGQTTEQPAKSWFDNITVKQEELYDLLSGDPARAVPVLKKFVAVSVVGAMHHMKQEQERTQRTERYIGECQNALYTKYEDLKNFTPAVKMAGDQIEQEYRSKGVAKYPHQLIDEIGTRARSIIKQIAEQRNGSTTPAAPRRIVKQGETGGNRITPPAKEQLSEQQKQMFDLMEE